MARVRYIENLVTMYLEGTPCNNVVYEWPLTLLPGVVRARTDAHTSLKFGFRVTMRARAT